MRELSYGPGDRVEYSPFGGGIRRVLVLTREEDVKGGQPGFTGRLIGSDDDTVTVWGYDSQITTVEAGR